MRISNSAIADYASDPALSVLDFVSAVTLLTLRPAAEVLAAQVRRKGTSNRWLPRLERRFRRAFHRLFRPKTFASGRKPGRHGRLADLYTRPAELDAYYEGWNAFIDERLGGRVKRRIVVAPGGSSSEPEFRLLSISGE